MRGWGAQRRDDPVREAIDVVDAEAAIQFACDAGGQYGPGRTASTRREVCQDVGPIDSPADGGRLAAANAQLPIVDLEHVSGRRPAVDRQQHDVADGDRRERWRRSPPEPGFIASCASPPSGSGGGCTARRWRCATPARSDAACTRDDLIPRVSGSHVLRAPAV
jgi:hypothetical protein